MGTHIVYLENRLGNRQTTDVIDESRARRIAKEMTDNGVIAEVFPWNDRPQLFAWRSASAKTHRYTR